jgi:hypothetical protein
MEKTNRKFSGRVAVVLWGKVALSLPCGARLLVRTDQTISSGAGSVSSQSGSRGRLLAPSVGVFQVVVDVCYSRVG